MTLDLSPAIQEFVAMQVSSGAYNSANAVIEEAITLLQQEKNRLNYEAWLDTQITVGVNTADSGDIAKLDIEDVIRRGHARSKMGNA